MITTFTYSPANRLMQSQRGAAVTTYTYDAAGNRTGLVPPTGPSTLYAWDAPGRLVEADVAAGTVTFTYNADGQRVAKQGTDASAVGFLYDHKKLLHETDEVGGDISRTFASDSADEFGDLIGEDGEFVHQYDAMANTEALLDNTGAVEARYKYDAFGEVSAVSVAGGAWTAMTEADWAELSAELGTQMLAGGKKQYYLDPEIELYLLGSGSNPGRYYDPSMGRFVSEDPTRQAAGDPNLFAYTQNNPINRLDPSGHETEQEKEERERREKEAAEKAKKAAEAAKTDAPKKADTGQNTVGDKDSRQSGEEKSGTEAQSKAGKPEEGPVKGADGKPIELAEASQDAGVRESAADQKKQSTASGAVTPTDFDRSVQRPLTNQCSTVMCHQQPKDEPFKLSGDVDWNKLIASSRNSLGAPGAGNASHASDADASAAKIDAAARAAAREADVVSHADKIEASGTLSKDPGGATARDAAVNQIAKERVADRERELGRPLSTDERARIIGAAIKVYNNTGPVPMTSFHEDMVQQAKGNSSFDNFSLGANQGLTGFYNRLRAVVDPKGAAEVSRVYADLPVQEGTAASAGRIFGGAAPLAPLMLLNPLAAAKVLPTIFAVEGGAGGVGQARMEAAEQRLQGKEVSGGKEAGAALGYGALGAVKGYFGGKLLGEAGKIENVAGRYATSGGLGGSLSGGEQLGQNLVAKVTIDPNREALHGVKDATIGGAISTAALTAVGDVAKTANAIADKPTFVRAQGSETTTGRPPGYQSPGGGETGSPVTDGGGPGGKSASAWKSPGGGEEGQLVTAGGADSGNAKAAIGATVQAPKTATATAAAPEPQPQATAGGADAGGGKPATPASSGRPDPGPTAVPPIISSPAQTGGAGETGGSDSSKVGPGNAGDAQAPPVTKAVPLTIEELKPKMVLDPAQHQVFRGGTNLEPSGIDVIPAKDGLIHPTKPLKDGTPGDRPQGLSLNIDPQHKNVASRGAYQVQSVPEGLQIIRDGTTGHFVVAPTRPMTPAEYKALCLQVKLADTKQ